MQQPELKLHVLFFWEGKTHLARKAGHDVEPLIFGIYYSLENAQATMNRCQKDSPEYDYKIVTQYKIAPEKERDYT